MIKNKFIDSLNDAHEVKITKKNFKKDIDEELKTKFEIEEKKDNCINLLDMEAEDNKVDPKAAMSIYFKESDLKLLKAISKVKNTTVNKTVMSILEGPLTTTRNNLPTDFDIENLAKEYDKNSKNKSSKRK